LARATASTRSRPTPTSTPLSGQSRKPNVSCCIFDGDNVDFGLARYGREKLMAITDLIDIPGRINARVSSATQTPLLSALGNPRGDYDDTCREVTHPGMRALIATRDVGPFRARGLVPALDALTAIFAEIKREDGEVFAALGTAGMLCARFVRGSTSAL